MGRRFRILSEIKRFATVSWAGSTLELDRKKSKRPILGPLQIFHQAM